VKVDLFDFELPASSIAQHPVAERDRARLLVVDPRRPEPCAAGATGPDLFRDAHVFDLPDLVAPGSLVVLNDTKVIRARLFGRKPTGGKVELLLVEKCGPAADVPAKSERWRALGKGLGELVGQRLSLGAAPLELIAIVERSTQPCAGGGRPSDAGGLYDVLLTPSEGDVDRAIEALGHVPLPPYVRRPDDRLDQERYQTVFARVPGAVAAPTAGLHFTDPLLETLARRGAAVGYLTLHVGPGTFQPVQVADLDAHPMHPEWMHVGTELAEQIAEARRRDAPVVAVGTTVVRALESAADPERRGWVAPTSQETRLLIQPGYDFRVVDALLTNFHLPRSTLVALVAAFAGRRRLLAAYEHAVRQGYRFYSYGDAMWLPHRATQQ
jgi:S-adenosylmethionine:tRNA ribosyltransferase-isomerase